MFLDPARGDYRVAEDSTALTLGFENFPMDEFGVRDLALKALARKPSLPNLTAVEETEAGIDSAPTLSWKGTFLRTVRTMGEASAAGLPEARGAWIVNVEPDGDAAKAGFMKGDVIWSADGRPVRSAEDLISLFKEHRGGARIEFWRNQSLREITLEGGD